MRRTKPNIHNLTKTLPLYFLMYYMLYLMPLEYIVFIFAYVTTKLRKS